MKQIGYITLAVVAVCLILTAVHFRPRLKNRSSIIEIPSFRILSEDSCACLDSKYFPAGKSTIFIYFDPDCEHCQRQIHEMRTSNIIRTHSRCYLITNADNSELRAFCQSIGADTVTDWMFGRDFQYTFYRAFLPETVPFIAVYNGKKQLVKTFYGETSIRFIENSIILKSL